MRCKYELGDIIPKIGEPLAHEHLLACDGSAFDTAKYVQLTKLFPNGTLPDLNGRFLQGSNTAGQMVEAGLPNISGGFNGIQTDAHSTGGWVDGKLFTKGWTSGFTIGAGVSVMDGGAILFDASKFNAIYGKSTTVQPPAYTVKYYICYGG